MSSPTPIITPPTKPKSQIQFLPTGIVQYWRELWKEWTTGLLVLIAASPEILAQMVAQGWLTPEDSGNAFKGLVFLTLLAKLFSQKRKES